MRSPLARPWFAAGLLALAGRLPAAEPDFNRDVRPILSNHCFKCHGPATQKAGVRLDALSHAKKNDAVVPGKPDKSTLVERVAAADDEERMPPPGAGDRLTPAQIATLKAWVAGGAKYAPHWAFVPPRKPEVPSSKFPSSNPIDEFILQRLKKEGLTPAPEADRPTLIRRATLDLIGLLPSPAEVDAFVKDASPDAYERVVDRLLASPHYGERQARHWLDLARYADSNGYTLDGVRSIWPYRDWVIRAFNDDVPFDRFTVEQLAGDLLPSATRDQLVATGFHRNTPFNEEGGADPEQFRVERVVDRASTTAAVWLGLTAGCAQCHDHKFDPVSQKDFFRLYAFFNSSDEPTTAIGGAFPQLEQRVNELIAQAEELNQKGDVAGADRIKAEVRKVQALVPTTLTLRERPTPRETFVQVRGDFLRKGDKVTPGFPAALAAEKGGALTRLDLARWLVSADNPLTARVTVNREWQKFFGLGLVETENDFGMQGSLPTHPELLDFLAVEFSSGASGRREPAGASAAGDHPPRADDPPPGQYQPAHAGRSPWSLKHLHRLIVTSGTYRQASTARPDVAAKDAQNKLLARQNRLRVEAEIIRDAALTSSGLLSRKMYGPGVYPQQPAEVFALTQNKKPWPESQGDDRFRRGLYTVVFRQSRHHLLTTFDAADAQTACTRRTRSNTPLQALHLANDPVFVELAAGLGKRIEKDGPADDAGKVLFAYKVCFGRPPADAERDRVLAYLRAQRAADAKTAWARVARVLMNLDEFVTRE